MKRNNKGFSLVELLIAMAVSSIVLTALVLLVAQSANRHHWRRYKVMLM